MLEWILPRALLVLGLGFLLANVRLAVQLLQFLRIRSRALLTWPGRRPRFYGLFLAMGLTLGLVIFVKLILQSRPPSHVFGETMMFLYYAYLLPLSLRIGRGFYEEGVWLDTGFMPYGTIGGISWREEPELTLVLIPRWKRLARRLVVPQELYGQARRVLRDKIADHAIHFTGKALDLGAHDERDDV